MTKLTQIMLSAFLVLSSALMAQEKPDKDKIKSLKIAFMTERLDLSPKEAQAFWPIYNAYEKNREILREREHNQIRGKIKSSESLSEKQADDLLEQYLTFEEEEEELDKNFIEKVSKVISAKKTLLLLRSEHEFKKELLKHYRSSKS